MAAILANRTRSGTDRIRVRINGIICVFRQDLARYIPEMGATVVRTETAVRTDLAAQVRVIRSAYEVIDSRGGVRKRIVEWPYRYIYRFEAEHLLERAGFQIEALHGGYRREPFTSDSRLMLFLARRPE